MPSRRQDLRCNWHTFLPADGAVHIYSRNSEDNTGKYPDIVANIPKLLQSSVTGGVVLDCEAVAYDREKGIILPFQVRLALPQTPLDRYCVALWSLRLC